MPAYSIAQILKDPKVGEAVRFQLPSVLRHLGAKSKYVADLTGEIISIGTAEDGLDHYENALHRVLVKAGLSAQTSVTFEQRAKSIYAQIRDYVGCNVCDIGCGDGRLGALLSQKGHNVSLCDTYRNSNITKLGLSFDRIPKNTSLPYKDNTFDTSLLVTVLHHSNHPLGTVREARRITKHGGRVVIIESVYGVNKPGLSTVDAKGEKMFRALETEQQRLFIGFFDHFYNRGIHYSKRPETKVNVPLNFNTPSGWNRIFEEIGLHPEQTTYLGVDQKAVPEYHTLHVCSVKK